MLTQRHRSTLVSLARSMTQLIGEVRTPIAATPGQRERYDCEYRRNGTANLFVFLDAHRRSGGPGANEPSGCPNQRFA